MAENDQKKGVMPSEFMRSYRPEIYSDTEAHTSYLLDAEVFSYHLETITARNQTHDFEIFCRKLCERTICPHLKPATGPEGGGDSKADTETIPVADEIAILAYVGEANAGSQRWAFAFSAMKKWADKARRDVAGIISTQRGYSKIYFITSQSARAKDRARVEDELSKEYGVTVTILDRSWIVEQVIDGKRCDLAFNYLGVGQETKTHPRLGPTDYSRTQQLEDSERALADPEAFSGMRLQRVKEALVAAKLSRNLERSRTETDGRFLRATRLAEKEGTERQKFEVHYEWLWTAFWWFDDIAFLNDNYTAFETLVIESDHAINLEFLCNLMQLLFNSVIHRHLTAEEAKLTARAERLTARLESLSEDDERPNNALEAETSLLILRANQIALGNNRSTLGSIWQQFSSVVSRAKGLGEYSADRLIKLIEVFGHIAGNDPAYTKLVDEVSEFASERTGEAQGALVLLKRAQQLDLEDNLEMIRLLSKAARQLSKKEHAESLSEALKLLSLAYRSAGLLWSARASCHVAITTMFIGAEEGSDLPVSVVPTVMMLAWICVELRYLPDALDAIKLFRGCATGLPLDEASKKRTQQNLEQFDLVLGSQLLNSTPAELAQMSELPDILDGMELIHSRNALLYALGYEQLLRDEGSIPAEETPEKLLEFYTLFASQPASDNLDTPFILNGTDPQVYGLTVQGVRISIHHVGSEASILATEAIAASIEAIFATALDLDTAGHTEGFTVTVEEAPVEAPAFIIDEETMSAKVRWPVGLAPASYERQEDVRKTMIGLAVGIFAATCLVRDVMQTVSDLLVKEAAVDRVAMAIVAGTSRQRSSRIVVPRLSDWTAVASSSYQLQASHPVIQRRSLDKRKSRRNKSSPQNGDRPPRPTDHRDVEVRSIIDLHLWNRAGWHGTAFVDRGPSLPPAIGLMFGSEDAARKIFTRWRDRVGSIDKQGEIHLAIIRGVSPENPSHYRILLTSRPPGEAEGTDNKILSYASRMLTMEPASDANLSRFLSRYEESQFYVLVPTVMGDAEEPRFLVELAILKRGLVVKFPSDIKKNDLERIALGNFQEQPRNPMASSR